jgi:hypothetical protein
VVSHEANLSKSTESSNFIGPITDEINGVSLQGGGQCRRPAGLGLPHPH